VTIADELANGTLRIAPELLAQINAAFAGRVPPDGEHVLVDRYHCAECERVYAVFRGRSWRQIDKDALAEQRAALSLFAADGFAYYLPAFLVVAASDDRWSADVVDALAFALAPELASEGDPAARIAALRPAELAAVAEVIRTAVRRWPTGAERLTAAIAEIDARAGAAR
jgi:hypothetical protein